MITAGTIPSAAMPAAHSSSCLAAVLYGGEANESIRYMDMEEEPLEAPLPTALEQWLALVKEEQQRVQALDVVRRVHFTYGETGQ